MTRPVKQLMPWIGLVTRHPWKNTTTDAMPEYTPQMQAKFDADIAEQNRRDDEARAAIRATLGNDRNEFLAFIDRFALLKVPEMETAIGRSVAKTARARLLQWHENLRQLAENHL